MVRFTEAANEMPPISRVRPKRLGGQLPGNLVTFSLSSLDVLGTQASKQASKQAGSLEYTITQHCHLFGCICWCICCFWSLDLSDSLLASAYTTIVHACIFLMHAYTQALNHIVFPFLGSVPLSPDMLETRQSRDPSANSQAFKDSLDCITLTV